MRKNIFALVSAFSVLMITTFNTAFCADNEDENKVADKKPTTALALDGRELKPLKKDTSDEFFLGASNNRKESAAKGGKGEAEQTKDDEKGRSTQDKDSSRGMQRKAAEDDSEKRLRIGHFVEYMRSSSLILPEELDYIRAYFINLGKEEDLTEQEQYDELIHAYIQHQKQTVHGNPSALTILSIKGYPVSTAVVPRTKGDASAPPSNHSEQKLLNGLGGHNAKGQKVALYTMNSPCMMFLTEAPCVVKIGTLARAKNIKDMMVQYDVFYEYANYKDHLEKWQAAFRPVKRAVFEIITGKLEVCTQLLSVVNVPEKMPQKITEEKGRLFRYLNEIHKNLTGDMEVCTESETFTELPESFAVNCFQELQGKINCLSLIWIKDRKKMNYNMNIFCFISIFILVLCFNKIHIRTS